MSSNVDLAISFHVGKVQELKAIRTEVENLERNALGFVCHQSDGKYMDLITGDDVLKCLERLNNKIRMNEERILQLNIYNLNLDLSGMCSFEEDFTSSMSYPLAPIAASCFNQLVINANYEEVANIVAPSSRPYLNHALFPVHGSSYIPAGVSHRNIPIRHYRSNVVSGQFVPARRRNLRKII